MTRIKHSLKGNMGSKDSVKVRLRRIYANEMYHCQGSFFIIQSGTCFSKNIKLC